MRSGYLSREAVDDLLAVKQGEIEYWRNEYQKILKLLEQQRVA